MTTDPAAGVEGGAGLIERDRITAHGSPAAVVLYVSGNATIVMAWNASGGADVDQHRSSVGDGRGAGRASTRAAGQRLRRLLLDRPRQDLEPGRHGHGGVLGIGGQAGRRGIPRLRPVDVDDDRVVHELQGALSEGGAGNPGAGVSASGPMSDTERHPASPIVRSKSAARFSITSRTPARPAIARP